ncbi:DoxX family protein [Corynebacterium diphtheriae]|uniref:DoxX family protein n=1 Tax=Corynebacterium diphtheriae TaxID=1717 RepID=UPI000F2773B3|nr:DoxX family protein [Corynebacterium diphtheriae]MBG9220626.1 DoxX family protein [Corynebacterium diphtheriae bv. mitis]MBG9301135.1 DoxX family protein [Corynebacterium diphtheriae bv. mitis]RKW85454.1 DoxX family protein [Corynebacterium diphtheriae]RKW89344.1 DoxX family protein [Corynebacterium diphtheriae]CAB0601519.1 DoxX family protein [Corynebacterium diphtheriae]
MADNNIPDRASDFDDDIPTYNGGGNNGAETSSAPNSAHQGAPKKLGSGLSAAEIYARAGRAAPQSISPQRPAAKVVANSENENKKDTEVVAPDTQPEDSYKTTIIERPAVAPQPVLNDDPHSKPLASDAPTTVYPVAQPQPAEPEPAPVTDYHDEDFAPTPATPVAPATAIAEPVPAPVAAPAVAPAVAPMVTASNQPVHNGEPHRRGTIDFGILVLRLFFGTWLILKSVTVFFAMGSHGGINALQEQFGAYPYASTLAVAIPALELAAGVFLVFGLLTPVASALAIIATSFMALHGITKAGGIDIFDYESSVWFAIFPLIVAVVLQFTGPGKYSFDISRTWAIRPLASSWVFVVVAVAAAVALWWFGAAVNPFA